MQGEMQGQEEEEEVVLRGSKCQDCGNQAKKECSYSRCRTCCKNKGFHCQTHIKSTWTPVDRRRHKQPLQGDINIPQKHNQINPYSGSSSGIEFKFPAATNSMAIFRCVQVRSMDDEINEIAYQTCVNIGGHVFSGLLYDQGPVDQYNNNSDRVVSSMGLVDHQQNIDLLNNASMSASASMAPGGHEHPVLTPPPYPFQLRPGMPYLRYPRS